MLSLLLLGTPQILRDDHALQIPRRKNRALLFYLAAHAQPLTRDQILALFFIDHERAAAQQILRTMLHDLRKQLGDALIVQDETLALAGDVFVDAREFESDARRRFTETSLQLYRGDFLEGFTLNDVPEFEDWVARERERLRALVIRGWMQIASQYETERAYSNALDALNHALAFDDLNEEAQRQALRVQYRNGDRAGAIRRFEQLQKKLDQELGVPPMAETRAVYDALVTDTLTDEKPTTDPSFLRASSRQQMTLQVAPLLPFIGRAQELQKLNDAASKQKLIWIQGEAGIGKTRLAEEFIATPRAETIVLRGVAHALEQNLPYQPIMDALRGLYQQPQWETLARALDLAPVWWAELARLTPELHARLSNLPAPATTTEEARVWEALHQFLARLGATRRVIFFLDDVHWADAATIGMLGYLTRHLSANLVLLTAARAIEPQTPAATLLQTLTREERLAHTEMDALSARDLETLAARLTKTQPAQLAAWLNDNTEGNPFLINELLRYAYDQKVLKRDGTLTSNTLTAILTPTIQNLMQSRVTRLNETARRVLQTASVIGREFDFAVVARAAELSEDATLDALDTLQRDGLVRAGRESTYAFDHHLTMQFVCEQLGAARQRVLHRRVAEAMTEIHARQLDSVAGLIARHFIEGGAPERAGAYALRAGASAARMAAWAEAIAFYEHALRGELDVPQRASAWLHLGMAHFHKGNVARATEVYREAFEFARAQGDVAHMDASLGYLNQSLMPQARYAEAIAWAHEARETGPAELALVAEFAWGTALALQGAQPTEAEKHLRAAAARLNEPRPFTSFVTNAKLHYQLAGVLGQQGK